jgi:ASC-1-like (ASCH) protein
MVDLVLHLRSKYFQQIKSGEKQFEYRLVRPHWIYRLFGRSYDHVIFWDGYKKCSPETVIVRPYRGYELQTITHPEFGPEPVRVFAIYAQGVRP